MSDEPKEQPIKEIPPQIVNLAAYVLHEDGSISVLGTDMFGWPKTTRVRKLTDDEINRATADSNPEGKS